MGDIRYFKNIYATLEVEKKQRKIFNPLSTLLSNIKEFGGELEGESGQHDYSKIRYQVYSVQKYLGLKVDEGHTIGDIISELRFLTPNDNLKGKKNYGPTMVAWFYIYHRKQAEEWHNSIKKLLPAECKKFSPPRVKTAASSPNEFDEIVQSSIPNNVNDGENVTPVAPGNLTPSGVLPQTPTNASNDQPSKPYSLGWILAALILIVTMLAYQMGTISKSVDGRDSVKSASVETGDETSKSKDESEPEKPETPNDQIDKSENLTNSPATQAKKPLTKEDTDIKEKPVTPERNKLEATIPDGPWSQITRKQWATSDTTQEFESVLRITNLQDLLRAARGGNANAQSLAAIAVDLGELPDVSHEEALNSFLNPSCNTKHIYACFLLAEFYDREIVGDKNKSDYFRYHNLACNYGNLVSCTRTGLDHYYRTDRPRNGKQGLNLLDTACNGEYAPACIQLGEIFKGDEYTQQNADKSAGYFAKACELGAETVCRIP